MRKILLIPLLIIISIAAKAQNHGVVKAIILDSLSKQPIQLATVSILKLQDSSLISYTVTDKNGAFTLHNLREEPSRLLITHVGYQGIHISIKFKNSQPTDLGKIYLSAKTLQEVMVKGERIPVMIKKDTIEFDATAFKTRPNALVEDLLKKLPGVQVDREGGITVNGKDISKIKVNGKDFFVNDPKIATRNLEANMISKVQVYDDRENDPDHLVPDYQVKKIINLKFKKSFTKGILSTLAAGAGTQDRYVGSGFMAKFQDDLQLSAKVGIDNLNGSGFFSGNYGGFSTSNFSGIGGFSFGNTGLRKSTNGNLDFTKDISKKLKLHIEYRFDNSIMDNNSNSKVQQNINDTIINSLTQAINHQKTNNQNLHAEMEWKPDSLTIIKYNPDAEYSYNNSRDKSSSVRSNTYVPLLNTTISSNQGNSNYFQYQHNFSYYRKLSKKGSSLTLSNSISIHPEHSLNFNANDLTSYVAGFPSDTLRRSSKNTNSATSQGLNAAYHYPITKKLAADILLVTLNDRNSGELLTYDEDFKTGLYTIFLQDQSSNLIRNLWGEGINPQLTYNFTDNISIKAGVTALGQQIGNHFNSYTNDLNQDFFYILPSAEVHVKDFTLSYGENVQQPSINSLQPITIVYSPLYTFTGNPLLKPTYFHNINFSYRKYNRAADLNLSANTHIVIEKNTIVNEQTITAEGANVTTPINRNGRFTAYLSSSISKHFKKQGKWDFTAIANASASAGHNFFIVNSQNGYQNTQTVYFEPFFVAEWNDVISLEPNYRIDYATTQYQLVNYPKTNYTTQSAGMRIDLSLPQNFRWRADYTYKYNPIVEPGFQRSANLLNFSVTRRIQKDGKGEIGLLCYDILNQNVSSRHYVVANTINDIQSQVVKRYLLLTYTYHFKKFK
ncbi:outer membrane beta-barrel protein [Mucilaginibacter sp. OK098]|uniref:outer membrane beta-barrel protein n=1 Tax=Mucilaginibacter sp. OK098 TaxID=1855297 RepID=UPI00091A725F|nr:outer membrane beta-barrel protein [Mucilaginibacter sp. OK098]SHM53444.1 CarboxypepD_reg-like domain-containing protein [Mucilaginibacter sp. OK098]